MNEFVKELTSFLDIQFFKNVADDIITNEWLTLPDPVALKEFTDRSPVSVYDYSYLKSIKEKYPRLGNQIKFMKSTKGTWPVHSDTHRLCAINIPIANTLDTVTRFYRGGIQVDSVTENFGNVPGTWYSNEYLTYIKNADLVFEHVLTEPTIVNTSVPHGIFNNGENPRIICSWAYNGTFEDAVEELGV